MSKRRTSILFYVYTGSAVFHGALALGAVMLPQSKTKEAVAIELKEVAKKKEPPKPPPPPELPPPPEDKPKPPPPPPAQQAQAKVSHEAKEAPPPPVPMDSEGFADLGGVALGNGPAAGPAVGGATPVSAAAASPAPTATAVHKVEQLAATARDRCSEPLVRPKRKVPVAPKYTQEARQAEIEGVVRVEVTIDETGHVLNAKVVSGLGYGLDEAALAAARASTFEPASRCGKAVVGTTILPFRFQQT